MQIAANTSSRNRTKAIIQRFPNIEALIPACKIAREELHDAAFMPWSDYDTNFEEKWIYRTTESGLTLKFLRGFTEYFSAFDDALNVIDDIVDEYSDQDELPEKVEILKELYEDYMLSYLQPPARPPVPACGQRGYTGKADSADRMPEYRTRLGGTDYQLSLQPFKYRAGSH